MVFTLFMSVTKRVVAEPPAYRATDAHTLVASEELSVREAADRIGFKLFDGVGRVVLTRYAAVEDQPIVFKYPQFFGAHPEIRNGKIVHGGTPIGADLVYHARKVEADLRRMTWPDGTMVAIDYEAWGPTMPSRGPYFDLAMKQAAKQMPELEGECLLKAAKALWQERAVAFYKTTIGTAKRVRPEYRFGFYYPQARHYWDGYSSDRGGERRAVNDLFADVWKQADWFAASVYYFYPSRPDASRATPGFVKPKDNRRYVHDNVAEWRRLETMTRGDGEKRPVYAVAWPRTHESNREARKTIPSMTPDDWRVWFEASHAGGADGLIIWGEALSRDLRQFHTIQAAVYGPVFAEFVAHKLSELEAKEP
jgi:hypothetical protein